MLLSINSKAEIKEISRVNSKKDFHFHRRTFLRQSRPVGPNHMAPFVSVRLRRGVGIPFARNLHGLGPPFVCQEGANPPQRSLHVVAICAVYSFHVVLPQ